MRKLSLRRRLADYRKFVVQNHRINRDDVMRIGEVSMATASADIKALIEDFPELGLSYDAHKKTYVATGGSNTGGSNHEIARKA